MTLSESTRSYPEVAASAAVVGQFSAGDNEQCLSYLYNVIVKSHLLSSYNEAISLLLEAGRKRFGMECAIVSRPVSDSVYDVQAFSCVDADRFYVGQHVSVSNTLCHAVKTEGQILHISDVEAEGLALSPMAYCGFPVGAYLGLPVETCSAQNSVLCFISNSPVFVDLSSDDEKLLQQIASGVAYLMDQQKTQVQRKNIDSTMFANGSLNTLDEYIEAAKLPDLFGIPGRVIDVLKERIGSAPLSIGCVAEDLNLSKRTLQRRLQQQSVNFAELRDQVRYHYSIDYLVKNRKSIDGISTALDFSDRTSFTNAFKRWTGMSPSTFRKLFRDFA